MSCQVGADALEKIFARLGEPRFMGNDFLYTLLLTYRYFSNKKEVATALINCYRQQEVDVSFRSCFSKCGRNSSGSKALVLPLMTFHHYYFAV